MGLVLHSNKKSTSPQNGGVGSISSRRELSEGMPFGFGIMLVAE